MSFWLFGSLDALLLGSLAWLFFAVTKPQRPEAANRVLSISRLRRHVAVVSVVDEAFFDELVAWAKQKGYRVLEDGREK